MSWFVLREIEGRHAFSTAPATGWGVPPKAETRHKLRSPPTGEEKTISLPSGVQAGAPPEFAEVSRTGSPPATFTTNKSPRKARMDPHTKATDAPSGEKVGSQSNCWLDGKVKGRAIRSDSESIVRRERVPSSIDSGNTRNFPSGDQ